MTAPPALNEELFRDFPLPINDKIGDDDDGDDWGRECHEPHRRPGCNSQVMPRGRNFRLCWERERVTRTNI